MMLLTIRKPFGPIKRAMLGAVCIIAATMTVSAQTFTANYDESKIPAYTLPDALVMANGKPVTDAKTWEKKRRPEILELFRTEVYGHEPRRWPKPIFQVTSTDKHALGGKATRKEVAVYFTGKKDGPKMDILIYLPNDARGRVPAFLGMNFNGNHSVHSDPGITLPKYWDRPNRTNTARQLVAPESSRASEASRWAVEKILSRGYALATIYYGDVEPDYAEGWQHGVRAALSRKGAKTEFAADDWGAISAWAWALSRALDYLEIDRDIDARRVAVIGHSRLGKTALWAGAQDERFAMVISNDSGCGGAALSKRIYGETVGRINTSFPHWFCRNFKKYNENESALPLDQHMLLALVAPRPLYVASAEEDKWADPLGEFLGAKNAEPVYRLFGKTGLGVDVMPAVNHPVGDTIGYHIRTGKHDVTDYDWEQYLNFADRHFGRKR